MRTIPQDILDALEDNPDYRINAKVKVFASRHYFKVADIIDTHVTLVNADDYIRSEAMVWNGYSGSLNGIIIDESKLKGYHDGSNTLISLKEISASVGLELSTNELSRPGIVSYGANISPPVGENKIYYWDNTDWKVANFVAADFEDEVEECIETPSTYVAGATIPIGAIYPLDTGLGEAVFLYIDEGGVRAAFVDQYGNVHKSDGRFMDPNHVLQNPASINPSMTEQELDDVKVDAYRVHYGGAAKWTDPDTGNYRIYIYYTAYNGSVMSMYYEWDGTEDKNGVWSEIFIAVPEDLSTFAIGNVFTQGNRIWMVGKFTRRSDFASSATYTLLLWSDDGKSFSLDRRTLVCTVDKRWLANYDPIGNNIYFGTENYLDVEPGAYQLSTTLCDYKEYRLKSFSGSSLSGWSANAVAGEELNFDYEWLDEGSYAELLVGISTDDSDPNDIDAEYDWITYQLCVVGSVDKSFKDGARSLRFDIVPDGIWHSQIMTYPFYMEIQGKQYAHSPMKTMDVLIDQSGNQGILWALTQDFSTQDLTDGFTAVEHAASTSDDYWCDDLLGICSEYPTFGDDAAYNIRIYGWSRAGALSQNPNVADDTSPVTDNDDFYPLILVEDPDTGEEYTLVAEIADLVSTYSNPDQTWFPAGTRNGSYPIEFTIPNPGTNYQIKKLGCRVISGSTGPTTFFLERAEMPGIAAQYTPIDVSAGYVIENATIPFSFDVTTNDLDSVVGTMDRLTAILVGTTFGQSNTHKHVVITTPDDGISHDYQIHARLTLVQHSGYYGGAYMPLSLDLHGGLAGTEDSLFDVTIIGDNGIYTPTNYGDGSYIEVDEIYTLEPNTEYIFSWSMNNPWPTSSVAATYEIEIVGVDTTPPEIPSDTTGSTTLKQLKNVRKGVPQIFFTSHSVWNFDTLIRARVKGDYSYVGCLGLGTDRNNFITGYMRIGKLGIACIRDGLREILYEMDQAGIIDSGTYDIRFWHRDGKFGVEYKEYTEVEWPEKGSQLIYEWVEADGIIAPQAPILTIDSSGLAISLMDISEINSEVWHVGVYSIIDPPKFRTTGFNTGSAYIPVMPLDINPVTGDSDYLCALGSPVVQLFPDSGQVDCSGYKFTYTHKNTFFSAAPPEGPFQYRAILDWTDTRYETDLEDSYHFDGDRAIEFFKFEWLDSVTHHDDYNGAMVGLSDCVAWENEETFFKPWITTDGVVVWQRERGRYYSTEIPGEGEGSYMLSTQVWLTHGLKNVSPVEIQENIVNFGKGSFVFLDDDDEIVIQGFTFYSGEDDLSITIMLDKFCRIAGTTPNFPGDIVTDSHDFIDGGTLVV